MGHHSWPKRSTAPKEQTEKHSELESSDQPNRIHMEHAKDQCGHHDRAGSAIVRHDCLLNDAAEEELLAERGRQSDCGDDDRQLEGTLVVEDPAGVELLAKAGWKN